MLLLHCYAIQIIGTNQANDSSNIGETGAVVQRDFAFGDENKTECRETAGKDGGGNVEFSDKSHSDRSREHNNNLLDGVE